MIRLQEKNQHMLENRINSKHHKHTLKWGRASGMVASYFKILRKVVEEIMELTTES